MLFDAMLWNNERGTQLVHVQAHSMGTSFLESSNYFCVVFFFYFIHIFLRHIFILHSVVEVRCEMHSGLQVSMRSDDLSATSTFCD